MAQSPSVNVLLPDEFGRYVAALALLVQRAGGTLMIGQFATWKMNGGELNSHYDTATDTLTVTYRLVPSRDKARWN